MPPSVPKTTTGFRSRCRRNGVVEGEQVGRVRYQREPLENGADSHSLTTHHALIQVAAQVELRPNDDSHKRGQRLRRNAVRPPGCLPACQTPSMRLKFLPL